ASRLRLLLGAAGGTLRGGAADHPPPAARRDRDLRRRVLSYRGRAERSARPAPERPADHDRHAPWWPTDAPPDRAVRRRLELLARLDRQQSRRLRADPRHYGR